MRALLIATAAGLVLLAGCGKEAAPSGSTQPDPTAPTKTEEPATDIATPEPPGGKPQDPGTTPEPPVTQAPSGTGLVVPAGVTQLPPEQVDATALPMDYAERGLVWVFDDGFSLQMFAMATSGCGGVDARVVDQTATEVRITLGAMDQPQGGPADDTMCTTVMTPKPVTVTLDAPLQDRKVLLATGR
jgi:hypothetical protein